MKMKPLSVPSVAALLVLAAVASAETQSIALPDTKPGHLAGEWLKFCDAPNLEQMTKWNEATIADRILKRMSAVAIAKDDVRECQKHGGFKVAQVKISDNKRLELLAQSRKDNLWFNLLVGLDD